MQSDPWPGSLSLPQSLNAYPYAIGNPLVFVDPDGRWIIPAIIGGLIVGDIVLDYFGTREIKESVGPNSTVTVTETFTITPSIIPWRGDIEITSNSEGDVEMKGRITIPGGSIEIPLFGEEGAQAPEEKGENTDLRGDGTGEGAGGSSPCL